MYKIINAHSTVHFGRTAFGQSAISVKDTTQWNTWPDDIKSCSSISSLEVIFIQCHIVHHFGSDGSSQWQTGCCPLWVKHLLANYSPTATARTWHWSDSQRVAHRVLIDDSTSCQVSPNNTTSSLCVLSCVLLSCLLLSPTLCHLYPSLPILSLFCFMAFSGPNLSPSSPFLTIHLSICYTYITPSVHLKPFLFTSWIFACCHFFFSF